MALFPSPAICGMGRGTKPKVVEVGVFLTQAQQITPSTSFAAGPSSPKNGAEGMVVDPRAAVC